MKNVQKNDIQISEFVKSLQTGVSLPSDLNEKQLYGDYLIKKYGESNSDEE